MVQIIEFPGHISDQKIYLTALTSVLPYKFKIDVFGNKEESIPHKDKGKTSPLSTSNFNEH